MEEKIDAYSLLHEYLKIYPYLLKAEGESKALTKDQLIRLQRVYALMRAYQDAEKEARGKEKKDAAATRKISNNKKIELITNFFKFDLSRGAKLSKEDHAEVVKKIKDLFKRSPLYEGVDLDCYMLDVPAFRFGMLQMMMLTLIKSTEFCHMYDKYMRNGVCVLPFTTATRLYFNHHQKADKIVEEIIVGLMGSVYKKSFTKEELVQNYDYPTETDEDLVRIIDDFIF